MSEAAITDVLDQTFRPGTRFARVVSLVPSLTETLFDLGAGERLVGRTDYCIHPADRVDAVPSVGGTKNPDLEAIRSLKPDLVLMDQDENRRADAESLSAAGVRVFGTAPRSVQEVLDLLWDLAALLDITADAGPRIQTIERAYDWVRAAEMPSVRLFCPIWPDPWMTFNAGTYAHDLLRVCGGQNVFADRQRRYPLAADVGQAPAQESRGRDTRYPRVTLDEVAERAPDLILLPSEPWDFGAAEAAALAATIHAHPALSGTPIRRVDGSLLFWPGTRLARALARLPSVLAL